MTNDSFAHERKRMLELHIASRGMLPDHFDELVWFDESHAVRPVGVGRPTTAVDMPETYPFAV